MAMEKTEMPPLLTGPGVFANETICYTTTMTSTVKIWEGVDPLFFSLPAILVQLLLVLLTTRLLASLLKAQPRVLCEFIVSFCNINRLLPYKRRTVQKMKADSDLRVLACIHTPRNVPTIINLLELSKPNKSLPLSVVSLHLVEPAGHSSATLIDHKSQESFEGQGMNKMQHQTEQILKAFDTFEDKNDVPVQSFTTLSPYSTMHEEICNMADEKRIAFVIVPFHKHQTVDGLMETSDPQFQMVNQNLLVNAPCSVGLLVDRGLRGSTLIDHESQKVAALFFGGPDDREALAYAVRMSEHPEISLNVIHFVHDKSSEQHGGDSFSYKIAGENARLFHSW